MTKLVHRSVVLAKTETTYNTDATPTAAANSILCEKLSYKPTGLKMAKRSAIKATLGTLQQINAGYLIDVSMDVEIKGSGTAGTAPELDALLLACGMASTISASTSVTYAPASSSQKSATIYIYEDGSLYKITGCRGTYKLTAKVGEVPMISFTMTGHLGSVTDASLVTGTYVSTVPPALVNVPMTIGSSYNPIIETLELDIGNKVEMPPDIQAADAYGEVIIGDRDVKGKIDPEATLVSTNDYWGQFKSGTTLALDTGVVGATAGNQWELKAPKIYYENLGAGNRNSILTYSADFAATETNGDDEFSLIFT